MIALLLAVGVAAGIWVILRGGIIVPGSRSFRLAGFDPNAAGLGALAIAVAIYFYGWVFGVALVLSVVVHEYGHVAAYRVCGHSDARFRLIPLLGGVAISSRLPATQNAAFFIAIMGPAICLAPMAIAFALSNLLFTQTPILAGMLLIFAMVLASFNFFNLLPFWPLDGGRMVQILCQTFIPWATRQVSIAMTVIGAALAWFTHSYFILFFILISWGGLIQSEKLLEVQTPMTRMNALIALCAYGFTAGAFFLGGSFLLRGLL
ncbi:MAG: site-2 protease family protein [bacterium]